MEQASEHADRGGGLATLTEDEVVVDTEVAHARPVLADDVQLVGEFSGSGFQDRQWLVTKNGRFLQLSEFLYRVLELADGTRSVSEIASRLGPVIDRRVSADNVEYLVRTKLIPMGLIGGPSDSTVGSSASALAEEPDRSGIDADDKLLRSALDVNFRVRIAGHRIEPVARALTFLHRPAILVPALAAVVVGHAWLYGAHGITGLLREAVANPDLVLVIIPVMLAAAVFHEFGHASALQYEGGRVRAMGAGFYLAFPALYTDVTDAYRLRCRARVRVDVGGPYFHLLAGLVLFGMYLVTGETYWLLLVVLTDIEVARQLLPIGRLDGYWTLADLSGIPDYYSRMVPELARLVGLPIPDSMRVAELTPRARRLFAAYVLVLLVGLPVFLIYVFTNLPDFIVTGRQAATDRVEMLRLSLREGDLGTGLSATFQLGFLVLEAAVVVLFIYLVTWRPARKLWQLGRMRHRFFRRMTRGAVLVVSGASVVVIGALLPWRTFHLTGMELSRNFDGITWRAGRVVLAGGVLAIVASVAMMLSWNLRVRRWAAVVAVAFGTATAALVGSELAQARGLTAAWIRDTLQEALGGEPAAADLATVDQLMADLGFSVSPGLGLFVVASGSLLAMAGGVTALTARWPTAETLRADEGFGGAAATAKAQPSPVLVRAAAVAAPVAIAIGVVFIAVGVPAHGSPSPPEGAHSEASDVIHWPPEPAELRSRASALGFPLLSQEALAYHTHQDLQVFVHGQRVPVPAGIGINPEDGIITVLHTHESDGVIHVEAPAPREFTLGQFFHLWGVRLTPDCLGDECGSGQNAVRVFVNRQYVAGDPRNIPLVDGDNIVVTFGTPDDLPQQTRTTPPRASAN